MRFRGHKEYVDWAIEETRRHVRAHQTKQGASQVGERRRTRDTTCSDSDSGREVIAQNFGLRLQQPSRRRQSTAQPYQQ